MQVREVMTKNPVAITVDTSVEEAARQMAEHDCGFLPIADGERQKLEGVVTDRDIVLRAVAVGLDMSETKVDQVKSDRVLYCYEGDDVEEAADSMRRAQVYRLIVLDDDESKQLRGIVTLGDIGRAGGAEAELVGETATGVQARH